MEMGSKRRAGTDELFTGKHEIKRRFAESSKNWNDLPVEMKMACIQWMDFETRCNLRQTARTENQLVETERYPIRELCVSLTMRNFQMYLTWKMDSVFESRGNVLHMDLPASKKGMTELEMIFRVGAIKKLVCLYIRKPWYPMFDPFADFPEDVSVRIDNFYLRSLTKSALPILRQCKTPKSIVFSTDKNIPSAQVFSLPSVYNTQHVVFVCTASFPYPVRLVEKWIENDCRIGQTVQVYSAGKNVYSIFSKKFETRIIYMTDEEMRISTNNKEKHVFLRGDFSDSKDRSISCAIVPADLEDRKILLKILEPRHF